MGDSLSAIGLRTWLFTLFFLVPSPSAAQESGPAVSLAVAEVHSFVGADGFEYELTVQTPLGYDVGGEYTTVYLLDGYVSFPSLCRMVALMSLGGEVPPVILVAVDRPAASLPEWAANRVHNLTPVRDTVVESDLGQSYGREVRTAGGRAFAEVLRHEVVPWVDGRYATSRERVLAGASLSGLFGAYVLLSGEGPFTGFLLASPSLWYGGRFMLAQEMALSSAQEQPTRVFLSAGELEISSGIDMVADMRLFAKLLTDASPGTLEVETYIVPGMPHVAASLNGLTRGLIYLLNR